MDHFRENSERLLSMSQALDRRTFLRRFGQTSGFLAAGSSLGSLLAACGNVATTPAAGSTPGVQQIGNKA